MHLEDIFKIFSGRKRDVLYCLLNGRETDIPPSTFSVTLKLFRERGIAEGNNLTDKGMMYCHLLDKIEESTEVIEKLCSFFSDHIIRIPSPLIPRLWELKEVEFLETKESLEELQRRVDEIIMQSNNVNVISESDALGFIEYYLHFMLHIMENVQLVRSLTTREVLEILLNRYKDFPFNKLKKLEIRVVDEPTYMGLTVTEKYMTLNFHKSNGSYDFTKDTFSSSPTAIKFATDLFNYFWDRATPAFKNGEFFI
jgi:predicted transcriptional regulator